MPEGSSAPTVLVIAQDEDATADLVVETLQARGAGVARFDTVDFPMSVALTAWPADPEQPGWLTVRGRVWISARCAVCTGAARPGSASRRACQVRNGSSRTRSRRSGSVVCLRRSRALAGRTFRRGRRVVQATATAGRCGVRAARTALADHERSRSGPCFRRRGRPRRAGVQDPARRAGHRGRQRQDRVHIPVDRCRSRSPLRGGWSAAVPTPDSGLGRQGVRRPADRGRRAVLRRCSARRDRAGTRGLALRLRRSHLRGCETPPTVREGVLRFLREFGLRFGAFDFSVDSDGQWWFLECNPAGQWGWLVEETGVPIADAIADELLATA